MMENATPKPLTPEQAAREERKRLIREHRALTDKATRAYEDVLARLPEAHRGHARRMERRNEPKLPLQFVSGLIERPEDFRRILAYVQTLYALGVMHGDAGNQWWDDLLEESPANHLAMRAGITRLMLSVAHDLDRSCRIRRQGKYRGGVRRMWTGSSHLPSRESKDGEIGWIMCLHEPGTVLYFPRYRAAWRLRTGDVVCFPREAYPGVTPVPEVGDGDARFTFESHPPPRSHQRTILYSAPSRAPLPAEPRPSA